MNQKKKFKRFPQKTLTIHHICSNCDVLDKKNENLHTFSLPQPMH